MVTLPLPIRALTAGKLQCNSVPTGAKITGDSGFNAQTGTLTATTNTLISNLRPGNYYVTVWGVPDYNEKTSMVNIPGNGGTRTFEFRMLKVDGGNSPGNVILISIEPNDPEDDLGDGAEIWIREISGDFAQIPGETTSAYLERDGGKYEIYVTKDGWITPQTQSVIVPAYEIGKDTEYVDVTFKLDPKIQSTIPPIDNSQVSVGQTATDTATVNGDSIPPTGTVTFKLFGPSTSADCNSPAIYEITKDLDSGSASCSYIPKTAGSYYWLASYSGDDNYLASTTTCGYTRVTVLPAATSTELASSMNPSTYGDSIKFTATVSNTDGSVPPAGSVQFKIDGSDFGSAVTLTDGQAISGEISSLTAGSHAVKAVFTDTTGNFVNSEKSIDQVVNKASTTINWVNPADITYGTALGVSAAECPVQQELAVPVTSSTGTFTYNPVSEKVLDVGLNQPLSVHFDPDSANYNAADKTVYINVLKAGRICTLDTDKLWTRTYDGTASLTSCSVSAGSSDGSMTFTRDATPVSTADSMTNAGSYRYTCQWTGGSNYNDCTKESNTLLINKATTSISSSAQTLVTAGGIATDTATLAGGYNPTGSIIFTLYGPSDTAICSETNKVFTSTPVTVNGNRNYISPAYTTKAVGTYYWIAEYSGNENNNGFKTPCGAAGETLTVNYIFNGFFPPIDMINVNTFDTKKTPPTIPLKWYLADGNGPVSDTANFDGVWTQEVKCDPFGDNPQTPQVESSSGGSGLQTPVNGNWQFNWAIKKSYSTHCKIVFVQFKNGQISPKIKYKFI